MPADLQALAANPYLVAIVIYLMVLVAVGVYKSRGVHDSADFMVAGRTLPWYILVGTLLATWIGNGSLFGSAGLAYRNGLASLWASAGAWVGIFIVYFIARRIRNFARITVPDIFEARYNTTAGVLATVTTVIAYLTIVSYQFRGGGRVLSIVTEGLISVEAGIIITAAFAITYTVLAGMISVVYTDVVNGVLMLVGVLATIVFMVVLVGGPGEVISVAGETGRWGVFGNWADERTLVDSAPIIAFSFFVPTMLLLMGDANMYQRIFSAENASAAKKAVLFWVLGVIVLEVCISFLGLTGAVAAAQGIIPELFPGGPADVAENLSENVIPTLAVQAVPLVIGMALVATMMAIVVSTADSFLLVPATNLTRDVYQRFISPKVGHPGFVRAARAGMVAGALFFVWLIAGASGGSFNPASTAFRAGVQDTPFPVGIIIGALILSLLRPPGEPHRALGRVVRFAIALAAAFVISRISGPGFQLLVLALSTIAAFLVPDDEEKRVVFVSRFMVLFLGFIAYLLVDQFPTILAAAFTAYLIYGAGITPALIAAFTWKRATKEGAVTSIALGAGVTLVWTFYLAEQDYFATWHPFLQEVTYPAVTASVIGLIIVSLLTPKPPREAWEPFFHE